MLDMLTPQQTTFNISISELKPTNRHARTGVDDGGAAHPHAVPDCHLVAQLQAAALVQRVSW